MQIAVLILLFVLWAGRGEAEEIWPLAPLPKPKHAFVVVAHRGNHVHAPENTLAALRDSIKVGADYMEIDLRTTKDGQIVLMHDRTVDRMTDGKGPVAEKTLAELNALKIRDRRFPDRKPERIPTFEAMLKAARGKIYFYLDCKEIDPAQVVGLLNKYGMEKSVVVYDGPEGCTAWKKAAPQIPVMTSAPHEIKTVAALENFWKQYPVEILDGPYTFYTPELVTALQGWNAVVWPDIQDAAEKPALWDVALKMGVQGLQTDHPAELIAYLKTLGKR